MVLAVTALALLSLDSGPRHSVLAFHSHGKQVLMDEYAPRAASKGVSAVVILYGSGGSHSSAINYDEQARLLSRPGRWVYLPHYLDITNGDSLEPALHYEAWTRTVIDALSYIHSRTGCVPAQTAVLGYSLGASVALSVAASGPRLAGVVSWNGSLPDNHRDVPWLPPLLILHGGRDQVIPSFNARQLAALCEARHFRCELNVYPEEGHAFSIDAAARAERQMRVFLDSVLPPY